MTEHRAYIDITAPYDDCHRRDEEPDRWAQFSDEQLLALARRHGVWFVSRRTPRAKLIRRIEAKVRP